MKNRLKFISGGLLALLVATAVSAQQSVIKVDITGIGVGLGSTPIAPVNERSGPAGTPITIQATAVGTFLKDSFTYFYYVNGQTIGKTDEPVAPPDSAINIWAPPQPGVYDISVTATDGANSATSLPVRYYATGTVVNSPLDGTLVPQGSTVVLKADATVSGGFIREIQFFDNGVPIGKPDTTLPYSLIYTPSGAAGTTHYITAQATDNNSTPVLASAPISIRVVNPTSSLPTCAITTPQKDAKIPIPTDATNNISIKVDANSPDDRISKVELYIDGELFGSSTKYPYEFNWHPTVTGKYDLVALASDGKGNVVASIPNTVTVAVPPTPTLIFPLNLASVPGDTSAIATVKAFGSSDAYPIRVQLFVDDVSAGNYVDIGSADETAEIAYVPTQKTTLDEAGNITPIPSSVYLFATDNRGFTGKSTPISIMVTKGGTSTPPTDPNGGSGSGGGTTPKDVPNPVYSGSFIGAGESGQFTVTKINDQTVTFMGSSTKAGVTKTYFFNDVAVDASGGFRVVDDQGRVLLQGNLSDINAIGTLNGGAATFIGAIDLTASGNKVAAGYYTGSLAGRSASALNAIVGANGSLSLNIQDGTFSDQISTTLDATGAFSVTTSAGNSISGKVDPATGFLTGSIAGKTSGTFTGARASGGTASDGFLRNISTRGSVGAGDKILIAGFVVDGTAPKQLLIRAAGPALASDLPGASLADPRLHVLKLSGSSWTTVGTNDDWDAADAPTMTAVGASTFTVGSKDAALVDTFAPGIYTAQVSSADATGGIALVEIYDVDTLTPYSTQKMINISTRGDVGTGDKILIAGFVVNGTAPKKVLVRGLGPTLAADPIKLAGAIADPALQILRMGSGSSTLVRENDNWQAGNDATLMRAAAAKVGATALVEGGKDAAILITLPPGIYTAQMSGTGGSTGIGLIEVYEVP